MLLFVEVGVYERLNASLGNGLLIQKTGYYTALQQMFRYNLRNIFYLNHGVEAGIRIDNHNRSQSTEAMAPGLDDGNLVLQAGFLNLRLQCFHYLLAAGGSTSCSAADQYM